MLSDDRISLNPNALVRALGKPATEFTKADLISYVRDHGVEMINLRYVAGDGRLKTLTFVITSLAHLDRVLSMGERVDGSSLFGYVDAVSSDLYVVPRYATAFVNPFEETPTLDILCSFYGADGKPLESAPEYIVKKAQQSLVEATGCTLEALGELEYYVFSEADSIYPIVQQQGYHESHPFSKWAGLRNEAMRAIASMGGQIKYGHAEVGNIVAGDMQMVQAEIEFLPVPIDQAADQLALGKWALREAAYRRGLEVSFAPKIVVGQAGSGMHVHLRLMKDGRNVLADGSGLTETAKKAIGGLLASAEALCAFGNTVPTSYLRLVPHQEAPTSICWGYRNRSALVRVPLGWSGVGDAMLLDANPQQPAVGDLPSDAQTVELRSPDGSAHVHLLLAACAAAIRDGLTAEGSLQRAEELQVTGDASQQDFAQLPDSCVAAGEALLAGRGVFEADGVFPPGMIDAVAEQLSGFHDQGLAERLSGDQPQLEALVQRYLHCG